MRSAITLSLLAVGLYSPALAQEAKYTQFGTGCAGSIGVPLLEANPGSFPELDSTFTARLSNVPDGISIGILGLSATDWAGFSLPMDLGSLGMSGCTLYTNLLRTTELTSVGGQATWDTVLPNSPGLLGVSFFQQVFVFDSSQPGLGAVLSNAAEGIVGLEKPSPRAEIIFPTFDTLTTAQSILVRGTATDPDGVAEIRVNGLLATTSDGFMNWQVRVPIDPGPNSLTVETRDALGNTDPQAAEARIESQIELQETRGMAIDVLRNRALVVTAFPEMAVVTVDLSTIGRRVLSDANNGIGPLFTTLDGIAIDPPRDRALVTDSTRMAVFAIDLSTGDRTILADAQTGIGPVANWVRLVIHGERALLVGPVSIISMDLATGNRTTLSDTNFGTGPMFANLRGIVIDGNRALVTDFDLESVFAVDLTTGDRTMLSSGIGKPTGITIDAARNRALVMGRLCSTPYPWHNIYYSVFAVDLASGDYSIVSRTGVGEGLGYVFPQDIVLDGDRALVTNNTIVRDEPVGWVVIMDLNTGDRERLWIPEVARPRGYWGSRPAFDGTRVVRIEYKSITSVDLATGVRAIISDATTGTGPELMSPAALVVDGDRALVTDRFSYALLSVDLATGNRTIISDDSTGTGPRLVSPVGIVVDETRALVMVSNHAVIAVDLATGDRTLFTDECLLCIGNSQAQNGIGRDESRILLLDGFWMGIVAIDLTTGIRSGVVDFLRGPGPALSIPASMAIDGNRALILDLDLQAVIAVDLITGNRELVLDMSTAQGPQFEHATMLALDGTRALVGDSRFSTLFVVDLVTGERALLAK